MKWSFKRKTPDEVVMAAPAKTSLFTRKPHSMTDIEDVEIVEVVSVMAEVYPDRDPTPETGAASDDPSYLADKWADKEFVPEPPAMEEPAPAPKKVRKPMWKKAEKPAKAPAPVPAAANAADGPRPLKVLIGFLPDSSEKDTYFYMIGVAQKNLDSENIGWAGLTRYENGYAYEIHEGGSGRGYLESLLSHFRALPTYSAEETHRAYIRTATRTVRVERTPTGLYSVVLPESDTTPQSDWLKEGKKLASLVEKRTGLFLGGVVIFMSSLIALMGGYATRYQPYTASVVNIERVPVSKLPHSQWGKMTSLGPDDYVMALQYANNEWLIKTPSNPSGKATPVVKTPPGKTAGGLARRPGAPDNGMGPAAIGGVPAMGSPALPMTQAGPNAPAPAGAGSAPAHGMPAPGSAVGVGGTPAGAPPTARAVPHTGASQAPAAGKNR